MTLSVSRPAGPHAHGHRDITETAAKRANMGFNPSGDPVIDEIKTLAAALYSVCEGIMNDADTLASNDDTQHSKREAATAMTQLQSAAMFAVQARARSFK